MKTKAVFPGTFDPLTLGHFDIIKRSSRLFDEVIVAIANSPAKHTMYDLDTRINLAKSALKEFSNVKVIGFSGMLIDFLKENQADVLVRGIRCVTDYDYESQLSGMYKALMPELEIVLLHTNKDVSFISSTFVRDVIIHNGDTSKFVPKEICDYILKNS